MILFGFVVHQTWVKEYNNVFFFFLPGSPAKREYVQHHEDRMCAFSSTEHESLGATNQGLGFCLLRPSLFEETPSEPCQARSARLCFVMGRLL